MQFVQSDQFLFAVMAGRAERPVLCPVVFRQPVGVVPEYQIYFCMELPFKLPDFIFKRSVLLHHLHDVRLQREHLLY